MPDRREASLTFSLEESVWFKRGQEVDELISISLNPHITVLEEEEYVVLKGTLELTGEYKRCAGEEVENSFFETGLKYVQNVEARNEEESEFSHHFPVDITIPRRRIQDVENILVDVQSFDYHLPENARLKVEADVHIYGLTAAEVVAADELMELDAEAEQEEISIRTDEAEEEIEEEEETEVAVELYERQVEVEEEKEYVLQEGERADEQEEEEEVDQEDVEEVEEEEEHVPEIDFYEPFMAEARRIPVEDILKTKEFQQFQQMMPNLPELALEALAGLTRDYFPNQDYREPESSSLVQELEIESSSSSKVEYEEEKYEEKELEKPKKKKDKYKSMSFADFFARKEEDSSAKLRVCLVQQGDTLQRLADKYSISIQQILRANQMDAASEVYEGQAIYIPMKTAPKR